MLDNEPDPPERGKNLQAGGASKAMPLANLTNMTDAERARWALRGTTHARSKMTTHAERTGAVDRRALR
jgi:hypothetical protein